MNISITENYIDRCGEVFLTVNGNLVMHCICEEKFYEFSEYANHVRNNHFLSDWEFNEEECQNEIQNMSPKSIEANATFASLVSEEDLKMFDDLEFFAPEPEDCKEIEEYVISLKNGEPNIEFKTMHQSYENHNKLEASRKPTVSKPQDLSQKKPKAAVIYKCPECDFISHSNSSINQYVRRHTGIKKVKCTLCPKKFYMPSELRVHMRFHTNEKSYLCTDCGRAYHTCSALTRHIKSCRNIRNYECVRCGKKFHDLAALRNHMTSHSDERSFHCEICGASFKLSKFLKSHLKIHENKQDYKCQLCPASFNQAPGLFAHLKSHSRANAISISVRKTS